MAVLKIRSDIQTQDEKEFLELWGTILQISAIISPKTTIPLTYIFIVTAVL